MTYDLFEQPVPIFVGLGMPRDITTVFQAYAFLSESSLDRRKMTYLTARNACLAAMNRTDDAGAAREAFVAYAAQAGILAHEGDPAFANTDRPVDLRLAG